MATAAIVIGWIFTILGGLLFVLVLAFWGEFMSLFWDEYYSY